VGELSTVGSSAGERSLMAPVTTKQMLTFKTTVQGNVRGYLKWFFAIAVLGDALLFLFNAVTHASAYHSTTGIWIEAAIQFAIFVTATVVANRKCARLIHLDVAPEIQHLG